MNKKADNPDIPDNSEQAESLPSIALRSPDGRIVTPDGETIWVKNGMLHRVDGPAFVDEDGTKVWCEHGQKHRLDGPAVERADGLRAWFVQGTCHRDDGPAVENPNGIKVWVVWGREIKWQDREGIVETFPGPVAAEELMQIEAEGVYVSPEGRVGRVGDTGMWLREMIRDVHIEYDDGSEELLTAFYSDDWSDRIEELRARLLRGGDGSAGGAR